MRNHFIFLSVVTLGLAVLHMSLGYVVGLMSGLVPMNRTLEGLMKLLTFPAQQLPEVFHRSAVLSFVSWFLCSLLVSGVVVMSVYAASRGLGLKGGVGMCLAWVSVFLGAWVWLARPVDDWSSTSHRYLQNYFLMLPSPIMESAAEQYSRYAIHQNLKPGEPMLMTTNAWYWNYRSGISGHPSYDAVVEACEAEAVGFAGRVFGDFYRAA